MTAAASEGKGDGGSFLQVSSTTSTPIFYGTYVEVRFRVLDISTTVTLSNGSVETCVVTSLPSLCLRGVMGVGSCFTEWAGDLVIECKETGLVGRITYHSAGFFARSDGRHNVSGSVAHMKGSGRGTQLCKISGNWTQRVVAEMADSLAEVELLPAAPHGKARDAELADLPESPPYHLPAHSLTWDRHPHNVWDGLVAAIRQHDWAVARENEAVVESLREKELKLIEVKKERWEPSFFCQREVSANESSSTAPWMLRDGAFQQAFDVKAEQPCKPWHT